MVSIGQLGKADALGLVTVRARVLDMYYDGSRRVYLTIADTSGRILVLVRESISQALYVGSIVSVHGSVLLRNERILISANDIHKLQEVEDGFQQLATIVTQPSADLPQYEDDRWIKPVEQIERVKTAVFARNRKVEYAILGVVLVCLAFLPIPFLSCLFCVAGIILIFVGLITETTTVTSVERASIIKALFSLLLSHHTAEKHHRCIHLKLGSHELHLCARCTGSTIGLAIGLPLVLLLLTSVQFENYAPALTAFLAIPAFIDWSTQRLGIRESQNAIRLVTGMLLGFSSALAISNNILTRLLLVTPFLAGMGLVELVTRGSKQRNYIFILK